MNEDRNKTWLSNMITKARLSMSKPAITNIGLFVVD